MSIVLNGRPIPVAAGTTVGELVDATVPDRRGVAVAVDGTVVPRTAWDATELPSSATVELVGAVQGG
ncbi:sulfur carrier protein ThiS [Egicoccus halophilus]|uniref:Thiamine biosynthesis protein ThiS n=1 Tax=Egicoccus halophilus TaxID=1670830 RepID=A0A8J3EW35_9ACTN|nr:sulfur carrier protein ThiS [Egicoccus halophilus]GGI09457.1 hypothetical protein GCM10011354_34170 [Egicoccus halophilus]